MYFTDTSANWYAVLSRIELNSDLDFKDAVNCKLVENAWLPHKEREHNLWMTLQRSISVRCLSSVFKPFLGKRFVSRDPLSPFGDACLTKDLLFRQSKERCAKNIPASCCELQM